MRRPRSRGALVRWAAGAVAAVGLGATLTACGNDGVSLARQACTHVDRSVTLYRQAAAETDPARASSLTEQAYLQLREALPLAAQAAGYNGQWQALMTTISESARVSESHLVHALEAQCTVAKSPEPGLPPPPSSVPPPATSPATS